MYKYCNVLCIMYTAFECVLSSLVVSIILNCYCVAVKCELKLWE